MNKPRLETAAAKNNGDRPFAEPRYCVCSRFVEIDFSPTVLALRYAQAGAPIHVFSHIDIAPYTIFVYGSEPSAIEHADRHVNTIIVIIIIRLLITRAAPVESYAECLEISRNKKS